jgi:hypothetical protein
MIKTRVVNVNHSKYDIYIGRNPDYGDTKFGNPFLIGRDGTREEVVTQYIDYIVNNKELLNELQKLKNKRLGCHCKPKLCHGDVLILLIEELYSE